MGQLMYRTSQPSLLGRPSSEEILSELFSLHCLPLLSRLGAVGQSVQEVGFGGRDRHLKQTGRDVMGGGMVWGGISRSAILWKLNLVH